MKNLIAALLTLCMVWSVVPETTTGEFTPQLQFLMGMKGFVLANTLFMISIID